MDGLGCCQSSYIHCPLAVVVMLVVTMLMTGRKILGTLVTMNFFSLPRRHMAMVPVHYNHRNGSENHATLRGEQKDRKANDKSSFLNERFHNNRALGMNVGVLY